MEFFIAAVIVFALFFAVYEVMNMPTHNGVTKAAMLEMVKWLWHYSFEMEVPE